MSEPQTQRMLRPAEVARLMGISLPTLYRRVRMGEFPKPVKPTERMTVWPESDVAEYQSRLIASRG